ncbi:hypothetical protein, partial [Streptococcus cristatus]|uniref:hypothetical protein n=1 Tax=Streptococcus cristatus TaxID=45634 RepID=UPI00077614D0
MAEKISIETTDLEQIISHSVHITQLLNQVSSKMSTVIETIPSLSSNGSFHDLIGSSSSNGGLVSFSLKAKEFLTLSEVFAQHIQNTYEKMTDVDRAMAIYVAEMLLNDSSTSAEDKQIIRDYPDEVVNKLMDKMK